MLTSKLAGAFVLMGVLTLTGCSLQSKVVKDNGMRYGYHVVTCTNMPDWADKVKEGLGQSKVCFRSANDILILPRDYDTSKL